MKKPAIIFVFLACMSSTRAVADDKPSSPVIGWGLNDCGQATGIPSDPIWATNEVTVDGHTLTNCLAIAAGTEESLALQKDGTVVAWGKSYQASASGARVVNANARNGIVTIGGFVLSNVVAISTWGRSLALRNNGTVAAWGDDAFQDAPTGLRDVVSAVAAFGNSFAVSRDGKVVGWPNQWPAGLSNVVAIAPAHIEWGDHVVLKDDGTVVKWNRGSRSFLTPNGLSNVVAVAAGGRGGEDLALRKDGTVIDLPYNSADWKQHPGLSNVVAIAAGGSQSMALKRDGTVVVWGGRFPYYATVPEGLTNVVAIAAGEDFSLALQTNSAGPITNTFPELPKLSGKP